MCCKYAIKAPSQESMEPKKKNTVAQSRLPFGNKKRIDGNTEATHW